MGKLHYGVFEQDRSSNEDLAARIDDIVREPLDWEIEIARRVAGLAHPGQFDLLGVAYIARPVRVAARVPGTDAKLSALQFISTAELARNTSAIDSRCWARIKTDDCAPCPAGDFPLPLNKDRCTWFRFALG